VPKTTKIRVILTETKLKGLKYYPRIFFTYCPVCGELASAIGRRDEPIYDLLCTTIFRHQTPDFVEVVKPIKVNQ
jgi:hypothetical protein